MAEDWYQFAAFVPDAKFVAVTTAPAGSRSRIAFEGLANRAEFEDFITYLRGLANEAWGPE